MSDHGTKSGIVECPGCEELSLVEAPEDAPSASVTCWQCERPFEVAGDSLATDQRGLR